VCWKGYFNLDALFSDIGYFFVLHIMRWRVINFKICHFECLGLDQLCGLC
jgi:hypothetical protein